MKHKIEHRGQIIPYEVVYAKRKTLEIRIHPDKRVVVKAPNRTPHDYIEAVMHKHAKWILTKWGEMATMPPATAQYRTGDTIFYLGRAYRLEIIESARRPSVALDGDTITIHTRTASDTEKIQKQVERWYKTQGEVLFEELIHASIPRFERYPLPAFDWRVRVFKARWGSCGSNRVITLNTYLMRLDVSLIEYVIVHEMCHLHEMNHGRGFYALMDAVMPDWKARRKVLKGHRLG